MTPSPSLRNRTIIVACCAASLGCFARDAGAFSFAVFAKVDAATGKYTADDSPDKSHAYRWDAKPFTFPTGTADRSLSGGLSYNFEPTLRADLTWQGDAPTAAQFNTAVTNAFGLWTSHAGLAFNRDAATAPVYTGVDDDADNVRGTDIDIVSVETLAVPGATNIYGIADRKVKLTNGRTDYTSGTIAASDIRIVQNPGSGWSLTEFQYLLAHEIGHALGLGDVESRDFWDTDAGNIANAILINQDDPINTPNLSVRNLPLDAFDDVTIVMETRNLHDNVLSNDDKGGLDFLYPLPEPGSAGIVALGALLMSRMRTRAK